MPSFVSARAAMLTHAGRLSSVLSAAYARLRTLFWLLLAQTGNVSACYHLAFALHHGDGIRQDSRRAQALYLHAINRAGHTESMFALGTMLIMHAHGIPRDHAAGAYWLQRAVDEGEHPFAMNNLAHLLASGMGVETDGPRAVGLFQKAMDAGNSNALRNLAFLLERGSDGIPMDMKRAVQLYERAIEETQAVEVMHRLGILLWNGEHGLEADALRAMELLVRAADGGYVLAFRSLGHLLLDGAYGVERDVPRAAEMFERAIDGGHIDLIFEVAMMHEYETGSLRDVKRALQLYERAVEEADDDRAMDHLGGILISGAEGMKPDPARAVALFERGANKGNVYCMKQLADLLSDGRHAIHGVEQDVNHAIELYEQALDAGYKTRDVLLNLAVVLEGVGDGLPRDVKRSVELYELAIDKYEDINAMNNLGLLLMSGLGDVEPDAARAVTIFEHAIHCGSMSAVEHLAFLLMEGAEGVPKDAGRAADLLREVIPVTGSACTMIALGKLLEHGDEGLERDVLQAVLLYRQALDAGHPFAADFLENCLADLGYGVTENIVQVTPLCRISKT